jgi:hypothetical protein
MLAVASRCSVGNTRFVQHPRFEAGLQLTVIDWRDAIGEEPLGCVGRFF